MLSGDEIGGRRNFWLSRMFQRGEGIVVYMTIANHLCGKVTLGSQFVIWYKGRNFCFVGSRGRSIFRGYAAFFDPFHQSLREGVRVVAYFIPQMSPVLPNAVCPDPPA